MYAIVQVTGLVEALRELKQFANVTRNMSPETKRVGEFVLDFFTDDVYESEGGVFGHGWPEVKMPYAFYKSRKWGPQTTLIASGKMRASNVMFSSSDMITIKNTAKNKRGDYYAAYHQEGGKYLPRRVLMDLDDERKRIIGDMILDGIQKRKDAGR